jgi:hypothetical protein
MICMRQARTMLGGILRIGFLSCHGTIRDMKDIDFQWVEESVGVCLGRWLGKAGEESKRRMVSGRGI